jgi:glucokinase
MSDNQTAIGIDLGGTRIKGVVVNESGMILEQQYHLIENDNWKETILQTVDSLNRKVPGRHLIGISAPGIPNEKNTCIAFMPGRLAGLEGLNWSVLFGQTSWVANDAIAAMAAESKFGVAKGLKHAVLLTLGTGVGGAILINGQIYQGAFQKAGHMGHISLNHEGEQDVTGMPGSLEDAIGNCTIEKRTMGRYKYTHELITACKEGDPFAGMIWLNSVRQLAIGIASITNVLSPEAVILGGGITEAGDSLFKPLEDFLGLYEWRAGGNRTKILKAAFGDLAGAIGAAGFALMQQDKQKL